MNVGYLLGNSTLDYKSFFVSPMLSITLLDSTVIPSIYYKYANIIQRNVHTGTELHEKFNGFGVDLSIYLNKNFDFYLGYSNYDHSSIVDEKINTFEIKLGYKDKNSKMSFRIFNKKFVTTNIGGVGFEGSYLIWKILLEGRLYQYFYWKRFFVRIY